MSDSKKKPDTHPLLHTIANVYPFFASDYINSETAFPFSQSHTAVFACGFNQYFTLLYGQFLTVWCQNCQAGGWGTG